MDASNQVIRTEKTGSVVSHHSENEIESFDIFDVVGVEISGLVDDFSGSNSGRIFTESGQQGAVPGVQHVRVTADHLESCKLSSQKINITIKSSSIFVRGQF